MVSQEVYNYWLHQMPGGQFSSLSASLNIGFFMSSLIWGPLYIPALIFSMLLPEGTSERKQTHCLPLLLPSQCSSLLLTWYVRMKMYLIQFNETESYASQVLTLVLTATFVWHQPGCHRDKYTWCSYLGVLGPAQPPSDPQINHLYFWQLKSVRKKWSMLL